MEGLAKLLGDLLLVALLPGFLAAKVRDLITERSVSGSFSTDIVRAMVYWLPILLVLWLVSLLFMPGLEPLPTSGALSPTSLVAALIAAVLVGGLFGIVGERRFVQKALKKLRVSKKTWKSPWLDAFQDAEDSESWAVVTLGDGTRFMGWAKYVSDFGNEPTVYLSRAPKREAETPVKIMPHGSDEWNEVPGIGVLLPPSAEIRHIDFLTGQSSSSASDTE